MAEFRVGDLVRITAHPLALYSGRVIALDRDSANQFCVEVRQTGLVAMFLESQ
jgi:hypothetical protein